MPSQAAQQFVALITELSEEYAVISKGGHPSTLSQSQMRMWVRTSFATLEALIYAWKQMAVEYHPDPDCKVITQAERVFAEEKQYRLSDDGDVEVRKGKVDLETNIRFAYKLLAKSGSIPSKLNERGSSEWQTLQKAIEIRNRITHPKSTRDLVLTGDEYNTVSHAFGWVFLTFSLLQTKVIEQAQRNLQSGDTQQTS